MKRSVLWLSIIALVASSAVVTASAAVKAGGTCSKVKATTISNGNKYTCIKSGKKLVWSKGVKVVSKATPTPSATPTPTPSASPTASQMSWKDPLEGTACDRENDTKPNQIYELRCVKYNSIFKESSNGNLIWAQNFPPAGWKPNTEPTKNPTPNSSATPNTSATPSASAKPKAPLRYQNTDCTEIGAGLKDGDAFYRCSLYQAGKLLWRWQTGPVETAPNTLEGQSCDKSFEITTVRDTTYRCLTSGTVLGRWFELDITKFDSRTGEICSKSADRIELSNGYLLCDPVFGTTSVWKFRENVELPTKNATKYVGVAAAGKKCDLSGDTFDISGGYLECRYVNGAVLQWIKMNTIRKAVANPLSPNGVEPCRLKNADVSPQAWRMQGSEAGFPVVARSMMNNPGVNNVLIVGMDFPEFPGGDSLKSQLAYDTKLLKEWFDFTSNGRVSFNVDSIDKWVRSSRAAKDYVDQQPDRLAFKQSDIDLNVKLNGQPIIDEITKLVDLRKYSTVFVMFPPGIADFGANLILRSAPFKIKEGEKQLNFFSWNTDLENLREERWWFYIHEVLHDFPLPLHAPGNGWINERYTFALNSWSRFQMNWFNDDQIYCVEKENLKTVDIALSPVETEDLKTKMVTIKLSKTKAIVVQAHGVDKWSSIESAPYKFPAGFYGVVAYVVDLENQGAYNFGTDGRATTGDNGNDPKYPKWSLYTPIDGSSSFPRDFFPEQTERDYGRYIAGLGDSFVIEGIKITLVGTGDYETVKIEKVG